MHRRLGVAVLISAFIALAGCPGPGPDPDPGTGDDGDIIISQNVTGPATWTADHRYHITEGVYISGSLTIEAGTVVIVDGFCGFAMTAGSTLTALGTADAHITFTSSTDQVAGAWGGIRLEGGSTGALAYCDFAYAGGGFGPALDVDGAATVDHCTFHDNLAIGLDAEGASAATTVTNSTFYANASGPLIVNTHTSADSTNIFHQSGSATAIEGNCVILKSSITSAMSMTITEVPYWVSVDVSIQSGGTLTIGPGVVVKFLDDGTGIGIASGGSLTASGTALSPITFTSWSDDSVAGNTDNNVVTTPGAWGAIVVDAGGSLTMSRCSVTWAGNGFGCPIQNHGAAALSNCTIAHNLAGAVETYTGATGSLTSCAASDNGADGSSTYDYYILAGTMTNSGCTGYFAP